MELEAWGCKIRMNFEWTDDSKDWLTDWLGHFQVLHGCTHPGRVCYGTPVTDRISSRLVFVFLEHVSEPKMACFHDLWNSMFFYVFHRFSIFTIFIKIWKSKFFLVFLNSLNSKNPTFSWVSWFPMVGPKPIVTGPKGFLKANFYKFDSSVCAVARIFKLKWFHQVFWCEFCWISRACQIPWRNAVTTYYLVLILDGVLGSLHKDCYFPSLLAWWHWKSYVDVDMRSRHAQ